MHSKRFLIMLTLVMLFAALLPACGSDDSPTKPRSNYVAVETSMGEFTIELFPGDAPVTVRNFQRYVAWQFYNGLVFHRVVDGFIIQGGAYRVDLSERPAWQGTIPNEAGNGLSNVRGTIIMARTVDPGSATSQFFINLKDNPSLDHTDDTVRGYGYAVFGRVVAGMDVVDTIATVPVGAQNGLTDVPLTPVVIRSMRLVDYHS